MPVNDVTPADDALIEQVKKQHQADGGDTNYWCLECDEVWPCPTARLVARIRVAFCQICASVFPEDDDHWKAYSDAKRSGAELVSIIRHQRFQLEQIDGVLREHRNGAITGDEMYCKILEIRKVQR